MILAGFALTLAVAGGCGSASGEDETSLQAGAPAGPPAAGVATPDPIAVEAYLTGLRKIHPDLALNQDRAVKRAMDTCKDIKSQQYTAATLNPRVATRLSEDAVPVTEQQAAQAIKLMQSHICGK